MSDEDFITVPVLDSFESCKQIGELRVLASALPPTPHFVFALGYEALQCDGVSGEVPSELNVSRYRLVAVASVRDQDYAAFLQRFGMLGPNAEVSGGRSPSA